MGFAGGDRSSLADVTRPRLALLTTLALLAFAGNSLLCRYALRDGGMDAASFTTLRLAAGAAMLVGLVALTRRGRGLPAGGGDWLSALTLFAYAAAFSFAYLGLEAASGALLLFGAVQATMLARGYALGERLRPRQWLGVLAAAAGLAAIASGALASGFGYALWYAALPALRASSAGLLQLSVPLLTALGGSALLDEPLGWRFALAAALTLGGIALATLRAR